MRRRVRPDRTSFTNDCSRRPTFANVCLARRTVVIELQKLDVFSDLGTFFYVRDMLREHG